MMWDLRPSDEVDHTTHDTGAESELDADMHAEQQQTFHLAFDNRYQQDF